MKDDGFYEPIILRKQAASQKGNIPEQEGRPEDISTPLSEERKSAPIGLEGSKVNFSLNQVKENMISANKLEDHIQVLLKKKFSKKRLSKDQKAVAFDISKIVMANEKIENWISEAKLYVDKPVDKNHNIVEETQSIAYEHQLDDWLASILRESKAQENE